MQTAKNLEFKFRYVQNGQAVGLGAGKATASDHAINLNGEEISYENILDTSNRDNRLILLLAPSTPLGPKTQKRLQENRYIVIDVSKVPAIELKKHIDLLSSSIHTERRRQKLASEGKENLFRAATCPHCKATVDLTDFENSSYTFCRFCGSIFNNSHQIVSNGDVYQICDECNMYDRVRGYSVFTFYFLVIFYGYSLKRRFVCDTCATKLAQRTLLINLLFLLGVPSAIYMWIKAQTGREPHFQELAKANKLARKGNYQEADEIYDRLFAQFPDHPGLLMNKGLGHLHGKDGSGGTGFLGRSVRSCANYLPSIQIIHNIQQAAQIKK